MCLCLHLLRHTHLPATKIECPRTFLVRQILTLPERLLRLITGRMGLRCLPSIKDAQTGHGHYLWLTRPTLGLSASRYLLPLPRRDIQRVDLFRKVEWSTRVCPIMNKLRSIMLQLATGPGWHSMTKANPHPPLTSICRQHLLTLRHQPGPLDPEEPHLLGLW